MQAIVIRQFGGPEVMVLEERELGAAGPGQVRIDVRAVGVNPHDIYVRAGMVAGFALPLTPGQDGAGVVDEVGLDVTDVKVGDRVYFGGSLTGAYADLTLCDRTQVYPLPESLSFEQGAALHVPYATAQLALFDRARAAPGETVLVRGASGAVGIAAVQLAHAAGLRVLTTAGTEQGRALAAAQGAAEVFDHHDAGVDAQIRDATDGRGVDVILEMLANENLDRDLDLLADRGRVVVVGNRGRVEIDPRKTMLRNTSILGMGLLGHDAAAHRTAHEALAERLQDGTAKPVIRTVLPLADARTAHELVMAPGAHGKIVLQPRASSV